MTSGASSDANNNLRVGPRLRPDRHGVFRAVETNVFVGQGFSLADYAKGSNSPLNACGDRL